MYTGIPVFAVVIITPQRGLFWGFLSLSLKCSRIITWLLLRQQLELYRSQENLRYCVC